jgi:signal transduction histidine kinase
VDSALQRHPHAAPAEEAGLQVDRGRDGVGRDVVEQDALDLVARADLGPVPAAAVSAGAGAGAGLRGIAERVEILGGALEMPEEDGRFTVEVTLPWTGVKV